MAYRETPKIRQRKIALRGDILRSAEALVREEGFKSLTIQAVASRTGISVGSIYRYFKNKDELATEVFRHSTERELNAVAQAIAHACGVRAALSAGAGVFAERAFMAPVFAWALIAEPVEPAVDEARLHYRRAYASLFEEQIARGVGSGELPPQSAELSAAALVGALAESLLGPLKHREAEQDVIANLIRFCLRSVGITP